MSDEVRNPLVGLGSASLNGGTVVDAEAEAVEAGGYQAVRAPAPGTPKQALQPLVPPSKKFVARKVVEGALIALNIGLLVWSAKNFTFDRTITDNNRSDEVNSLAATFGLGFLPVLLALQAHQFTKELLPATDKAARVLAGVEAGIAAAAFVASSVLLGEVNRSASEYKVSQRGVAGAWMLCSLVLAVAKAGQAYFNDETGHCHPSSTGYRLR